jgi:hypothetical protein
VVGTIVAEVILHPGERAGQRPLGSGYLYFPTLDARFARVAVRLINEIPAVAATLPEGSFTPAWAIHIVPPDASLSAPLMAWPSWWNASSAPQPYRAQWLFARDAGGPWTEVGAPQRVEQSQGVDPHIDLDRPGLWTVVQLPVALAPALP